MSIKIGTTTSEIKVAKTAITFGLIDGFAETENSAVFHHTATNWRV